MVRAKPSFREAVRFWLKLGCIGFGGPAGQIAIMHRELVERRRWIAEADFSKALDFCMLLPRPEAQQLATCAWLAVARNKGRRGSGSAVRAAGGVSSPRLELALHGGRSAALVGRCFPGSRCCGGRARF